jgi:hypothetical protein
MNSLCTPVIPVFMAYLNNRPGIRACQCTTGLILLDGMVMRAFQTDAGFF